MKHSAVIVASVAAFLVGAVWYSPLLFGEAWMMLRGADPAALAEMPPGEILGELARAYVVARVLAHVCVRVGVVDWQGGLRVGLCVWIGFQAMLLLGAVLHEDLPLALYAIHAGDALVKTMLMGIILGAWSSPRVPAITAPGTSS